MSQVEIRPMVFDPSRSDFPKEPDLPDAVNMALRASLVGWLRARLEELEGDCLVKPAAEGQEDQGILEAVFPAMPAKELVEKLAERQVYCTVGDKNSLRFTISAGQAFEPLDTVQAIIMDILGIE